MTHITKQTFSRVPAWAFFVPYSIVVIVALLLVINYLANWQIQNILPQSAEKIFVLGIIFENPHIIASNLMMVDNEYLRFYRSQLVWRVLAVAVFSVALILAFGPRTFYTFFYAWTVYHVARQQLGIGKMFNRQISKAYTVWSWLFVGVSLIVAVGIGFFQSRTGIIPPEFLSSLIVAGTAIVGVSGLGLLLAIKTDLVAGIWSRI